MKTKIQYFEMKNCAVLLLTKTTVKQFNHQTNGKPTFTYLSSFTGYVMAQVDGPKKVTTINKNVLKMLSGHQ